MATTTIPWNDGSGDNITLTYTSASGSQTVSVSSDANMGLSARMKNITFTSGVGSIVRVLTVIQESNSEYVSITYNDVCITYNDAGIAYPFAEDYIVFADPLVEQICATNWGDGTGLKPSQAAAITDIGTVFSGTAITSFDEFGEYFTGVTNLVGANSGDKAFSSCTSLKSITIPSSVVSTGGFVFYGDTALESFVVPSTMTNIGQAILQGCTGLKSLIVNISTTINNIINPNGHCGDGTGTMVVNGDFDHNARSAFVLDFNKIHITGDITHTANGTQFMFTSSYLEQIIIDGNINRYYTLCGTNSVKFFDIGGTYNYMVPYTGHTGTIVHLRYNGIAGTPANMRIARIDKVYVDSQAVLNQYLADSNWSSYSSKLDLWDNYTGIYKD